MTLANNPMLVERSALGRLLPLGSGGTAKVFRCPDLRIQGFGDLVYKEYKPKIRKHAGPSLLPGLLSLAQFRDGLTDKQRDSWDRKLVWPLRVVVEGNAAVGILMRLIPPEYFMQVRTLSGAIETVPTEIQLVFGADDDARRFGFPAPSIKSRLTLCSQIVTTYALAHQRGLIAGDVSGRNLVFCDGPLGPRTLLVDCDSFRVVGKRAAFGNQPHTGSWEPPEALDAAARHKALRRDPSAPQSEVARLSAKSMTQSKGTDVYKIGLLVVRILDYGRCKTRNRNPANALRIVDRHMPRASADVLLAALDKDPKNRPALLEWHNIWHGKPARPVVAPVPSPQAEVVGQGSPPVTPPAPAPVPVPSATPAPLATGSWEWVDGRGWTRRGAGSAP